MQVTVRRAAPRDAAAFARLMSDPAVFGNLMQLPLPSEELWQARLAELCKPDRDDLMLVAEVDATVVGSAGVHPCGPSRRRRHAMALGISVLPAMQRQGVGSALMATICDWADNWAGVLRLELDVYTDNAAAIALYRKFGFVLEGTHRAYALRGGAWVDSHSMARLHPRPPALPVP